MVTGSGNEGFRETVRQATVRNLTDQDARSARIMTIMTQRGQDVRSAGIMTMTRRDQGARSARIMMMTRRGQDVRSVEITMMTGVRASVVKDVPSETVPPFAGRNIHVTLRIPQSLMKLLKREGRRDVLPTASRRCSLWNGTRSAA